MYPDKEVWNYVELADVAYGTAGKIVVLLLMFGVLMLVDPNRNIMIFARDQLQDIIFLALLATGHIPECSPLLNCGVLIIICVSFVAMAMTIDTAIYWNTFPIVNTHNSTIQLIPVDFVGAITAMTYCSSSFICHFNVLRLQKELNKPATKLRRYTIITAMLVAYFLYNVVVFAGYFRFFDALKENVMLNYSTDNISIQLHE